MVKNSQRLDQTNYRPAPSSIESAPSTQSARQARFSLITTRFSVRFGMVMVALATFASPLQAQAQSTKTAGPAIPKGPATPPRPVATPAPAPPAAAVPTRPATTPRPRPAVVRAVRTKAKATPKPKRAVVKTAKASPKPKARTASSNTGTSSGGGFGQGASGAKVTAVQEKLVALHYYVTNFDGKYGDQLYHAVMAFQKVNGLSRTGRVTNQTLTALETATDPAALIATGGADRIEVDLEKQFLALYKDGSIYRLLSISSGSGKNFCVFDPETKKTECDEAVTPGGSFRVRSRWVGWRESKLGLLYNPLYFNGGIAIHGAPSVPATPASHGCVRIPMISAQWFPDQVGDGTPVYVFGGKEGAPVPLKSKAPADAKISPTTAPANTLATIPPAGQQTPTQPGASTTLPVTNTLAPATTIVTTTLPPTTTTTGLARLLTPPGTPAVPVSTVAGVITGTVTAGATTTTTRIAGATPIATQVTGTATTTTSATAIVTTVGATPIATSVSGITSTTAATTTTKP
jgi:lipoprotein-anchoring transpeptidase ErfK/SrfK